MVLLLLQAGNEYGLSSTLACSVKKKPTFFGLSVVVLGVTL